MRLNKVIEPVLSGTLHVMNESIPPIQPPSVENSSGEYEVWKIIGLCGKDVVVQWWWATTSVGIISRANLMTNATDLWNGLLVALGEIRGWLMEVEGRIWDLWVIDYFLGNSTDCPRSEWYYMELEQDTGYRAKEDDLPDD
jgi:hypothetical protein